MIFVQMLSTSEQVYYTYANAYVCNKLKKLQVISKPSKVGYLTT